MDRWSQLFCDIRHPIGPNVFWPIFRVTLAFSSRPLIRVPCKRVIMVQKP